MITSSDWLPIGSVVHIEGYEGLVMVTTCIVADVDTGVLWDYAGVPYPMGKTRPDDDVMFDRESIDGIFYLGYQDDDNERYQDGLKMAEEQYAKLRAESRGLA